MRKSLLVLALALVVILTTGTVAMADTVYTFIYQNGNISPGASSYGTVTLSTNTTDPGCSSGCLNVLVTMSSPYELHTNTGNAAFGFNVGTTPNPTSLTFLNQTTGATLLGNGLTNGGNGVQLDGYGKFEWGISLQNLAAGGISSITFDLLGLDTTSLNQITSQGANKTYFAAFITPGTSCTGYVATGGPNGDNTNTAGSNTPSADAQRLCGSTSTPEPASLALLSVGLIGLGGLVRRRK